MTHPLNLPQKPECSCLCEEWYSFIPSETVILFSLQSSVKYSSVTPHDRNCFSEDITGSSKAVMLGFTWDYIYLRLAYLSCLPPQLGKKMKQDDCETFHRGASITLKLSEFAIFWYDENYVVTPVWSHQRINNLKKGRKNPKQTWLGPHFFLQQCKK